MFLTGCGLFVSQPIPTPLPISSPITFTPVPTSTTIPAATATPLPKPTSSATATSTVTPTSEPKALDSSVLSFADQLSSCVKYKSKFIHPLTGETLEKEVLGIIAGKCNYIEQMPNGGKMECKYTESERKAVAQYYKDVEAAESIGTSVNSQLESGSQKTIYTINGKVVENPLQESMNNGVCVISGY